MLSVVISVGSNCGDRKANVEEALRWLKSLLMQTKCSPVYETPCALESGTPYMNAVISGFYEGVGYELNDRLKMKEHEMGRNADCRSRGEVPVDMDIVMENGEVVKEWDFRQKFFQIGYSSLRDEKV